MERCIRDYEERIIGWCVGMSEEDINQFIDKYSNEGAHLSTYEED